MSLEQIRDLARAQRDAEEMVEAKVEELKIAERALNEISLGQLPALMDELELVQVTTEDGITVKVEDYFTASASKRNFPAVLEHLERLNAMDIVKHQVVVPMTADMVEKIPGLLNDLQGQGFDAADKQDINTGTLKAFVKEQLAKNQIGPNDLATFGVFEQRRARITV